MKFKLNIIKLVAIGCLVAPVAFTSCSEDVMDSINENTGNPNDVYAKFILADVITSTAFSNSSGDINTYLSAYVEHEVGTHNQLWNAEHRVNEPSASSTFNNSWNSIYATLRNAHLVISKCSPEGQEADNFSTLGAAQVLTAYNLALLTDMYGDVPYSEALDLNKTFTPKIDKQEEIYAEVIRLLDESLVNLPKGDKTSFKSHDLLFKGDISRWVKFAHGLKARYTMRLLKVSKDKTADLNKVLTEIEKSFTSAAEEGAFNVYNAQNLNPFFDFQWSRDGLAASRSIADKMIDRKDPRLHRNFVNSDWVQRDSLDINKKQYDLLAPNGDNEQVQGVYNTSIFVYSQTASTQLLSYHELLFLKAEAMQRLGQAATSVEAVLKAAVTAAFKNSEKSIAAALSAPALEQYGSLESTSDPVTDDQIEAYFNSNVKPLFLANGLKEIANQKYLAFFGASGESTEMYNDIRRWKALGEDLVVLKNANKFPLRLPYGNSETTTNPNVQQAYGDGQYVYSENVWWAGGTR